MLRGQFDMHDFLEQIKTIQKMGSLADLFDKLPFFPNGLPDGMVLDDRELVKIEAMINSMTKPERKPARALHRRDGGDARRQEEAARSFTSSRVAPRGPRARVATRTRSRS